MGQQQLLLVILVTILVGIATVVAINVFGTAAQQSNRDAVRQDLLSAASQAQAIWERPAAMGGYGGTFIPPEGQAFDLRRLNIPRSSDPDDTYTAASIVNDNGTYTFTPGTADAITIIGVPNDGEVQIQVTITRVTGTGPDTWEITWAEVVAT